MMPKPAKKVVIESPYRGDVERNLSYLYDLMRFCFKRGEAPIASHDMYTRALDDDIADERDAGIEAGLIWARGAEKSVVGIDLGVSHGMLRGVLSAREAGRPIEIVSLFCWRDESFYKSLEVLRPYRHATDVLTFQSMAQANAL